jgi:hypothetical protein
MASSPKSRQTLPIHEHRTDQTCHWVSIFKPLSFIVFRDSHLAQKVLPSIHQFDAADFAGYAKWLCELGENGLNLLDVFLRVCEHRGFPELPILALI